MFELPQLYLPELERGSLWWHCFRTRLPGYICGPLVATTQANRFALVNNVPTGTVARPTHYIGETARSALHETVLRGTNLPDSTGHITLRPGQLTDRALACLELVGRLPALKLFSPARARLGIAKGTPMDRMLDELERTDYYPATHEAAGRIDAQCRADPSWSQPLPALLWSSRQIPQDLVGVVYTPPHSEHEPPHVDALWRVVETIPLESRRGRLLIEEALAAGDMRLGPDPRFAPPPGADPDATP